MTDAESPLDDLGDIAAAAFDATRPPLERMYDAWLGPDWREAEIRPGVTFRLTDPATNLPRPCRICGQVDRWIPEEIVFVCEHEPMWIPGGALRQLDSVRIDQVEAEPVERASDDEWR